MVKKQKKNFSKNIPIENNLSYNKQPLNNYTQYMIMKTQRFSDVEKFLSVLDTDKEGREDIVFPVKQLGMTDGQLVVEGESLKLSPMATKQMAGRLGIAPVYWNKMIKFKQFDLLDENVNRWLSLHDADDSYLVSKKGDTVMAFLSPRYKIIDNYDILSEYLESHKEKYGDTTTIRQGWYSEEVGQAGVQMISLEMDRQIASNDPYAVGSAFKFSDVGGGISLAPIIWRQICSNGMMGFKEGNGDKIKLNGRFKENRDYRRDPIYAEERPIVMGLTRSLARKEINRPEVQARIENLLAIKDKKIDDLEATVVSLKSYLGLSQEDFSIFMETVIADKVDNYYDLVQAITKIAQDVPVDNQVRLEQVGGWLTDNSGKILDHIMVNIPKIREKLDKREQKNQ